MRKISHLIFTNLPRKILSIIFGSGCWYFINRTIQSEMQISVPLSFYNSSPDTTIIAPEKVEICLRAQRNKLQSINPHFLAFHIDTQKLAEGSHTISLDAHQLFLPQSIKLIHYTPSPLVIEIQKGLHT